jgi:DIM1 family U5 snRNP protein
VKRLAQPQLPSPPHRQSVLLTCPSPRHVDQAILSEERRIVILRFGRAGAPPVMAMDEHLYKIADKIKNFATVYLVDNAAVPDFNAMYEIYDECTVMFFWR